MKHPKLNYLMLLISGIGIGWLAGLSVSPVIAQILSTILGVLAAVLAVLSGVKWTADQKDGEPGEQGSPPAGKHALQKINMVSAVPAGILIVGLVFGSMLGMTARTHDWFGFDPAGEIDRWTGLGLEKKEVAQVLMQAKFGSGGQTAGPKENGSSGTAATTPKTTALYGITAKECDGFYGLSKIKDLRLELSSSPNRTLQRLESKLDDKNLKEVIGIICDW